MAREAKLERIAGISSEAVKEATGRTWAEWLRILDRAGAAKMSHPEIARYLHAKHAVRPWWTQMVTVGYEQARGRRAMHQAPDGFQTSASRVIGVPVSALFAAWRDRRGRARWMTEPDFTIRKATPDKSMRITWTDGKTSVEANFYAKGAARSQVAVQHRKLRDARHVAQMKKFWSGELDRLKVVLEK